MAKGIAITITRKEQIREYEPGEARAHSVWNGTRWITLWTPIWSPKMAKTCGVEPQVITTRLEFLPPGTETVTSLGYRRLLPELRKAGHIK